MRGPGMPGGRGPRWGSGDTADRVPGGDVAGKREAQDTASETQSRLSLGLHWAPGNRGYMAGWQAAASGTTFVQKAGAKQAVPRWSGEDGPPIPVCAPAPQQGFDGREGEGLETHVCDGLLQDTARLS